MAAAPALTVRQVERVETLLARAGPYYPVIARNVADNMRALGVYSSRAHRDYFAQLGAHFAGALHVFRCAGRIRDGGKSDELARLTTRRIELDQSVACLGQAARRRRGAIVMGPHIANYLLGLARLSQEIPLTIYFRSSPDLRRQVPKQRWCRAAGIEWLFEPAVAGRPPGRVERIAAALNEGRTVFVPPDLPRKRGQGTPVRFFRREIYLPAGPAVLAVRTGAPLFVLLAQARGPRQKLVLHGPSYPREHEPGSQAERAAVQQHMQWFVALFERFLTEQTPLWYFWGDKRWTQVLHGDPRYLRPLDESASAITPDLSTGPAGAV